MICFVNRLLILGLSAPIVALLGATISISLSGNWNFMENSIRDLGRLGSDSAAAFNSSLICAGLLGFLYAFRIYLRFPNPERVSMSFLVSAFIFLILIGIFPAGTQSHSSICLGFILSAFSSMLLLAIFSIKKNKFLATITTAFLLLCSISGIFGMLHLVRIAFAELAAISGFFIWYSMIAISLWNESDL